MILVPFQLFVGNAIDFIGFDRRWRVSRPKLQKQVGTALAESHPPSMAHRIMRTAMREYKIAAIPGDGIGGEATTGIVTAAVCDSL